MELIKDIEKLIEYIKRCNWWVQEEEVNEDYTIFDYQKDARKLLEEHKDKNKNCISDNLGERT